MLSSVPLFTPTESYCSDALQGDTQPASSVERQVLLEDSTIDSVRDTSAPTELKVMEPSMTHPEASILFGKNHYGLH